jgi:alpha-L-fucosidase
MGVHCDNFDLWNSKYHRWNAVRMGPKKDIVGLFRKATLKAGLRFGVSEHVWGSYNWFATNKGADKEGPYAGVPYDGNDPANRDLYHEPHDIPPGASAWAELGNEPVAWKREWLTRMKDLVDQYQPDLLYHDGPVTFGEWGLALAAHYYNQSAKWHKGVVEGIHTIKSASDCAVGTCVLDLERGVTAGISVNPCQSETCIGGWHYDKEAKYKTPKTIIDMLVDVVSRNGNLLLNFPLPNSGELDAEEMKIVSEITKWMAVNSQGIYGTRPWKTFGDGPVALAPARGGAFNEQYRKDFTAEEVRFTTKGKTIYAFVMGWPEKQAVVKPLGVNSSVEKVKIGNVELLGFQGKVKWTQDDKGLTVQMPEQKPCDHAIALKIVVS